MSQSRTQVNRVAPPQHNAGLRVRTQIVDVVLAGCSEELAPEGVEAVVDCALGGLTAAIRSQHHLVDWEEYVSWGAL